MIKIAAKIIFLIALLALAFGLNPADFPRAQAAETGKGRIIVRTNFNTSWVISGPQNFSGTGNFASYYADPGTVDYFISAPILKDMNPPKYLPGMNQTLRAGETIYFDINYTWVTEPPLGTGPEDCKLAYRYLEGRIIDDGHYSGVATGKITNNSKTCTYPVGIASYKMFMLEVTGEGDEWIKSQKLDKSTSLTVGPGQTLGPDVVRVGVPSCRAQIDLFEGAALIEPVYNTEGHILMDFRWVDKEVCSKFETGVLTVNSNIPTSWMINGPQNYSGSGVYGAYTTRTGDYTLNSVPTTLAYDGKTYELLSPIPQTQTVSPTTMTRFVINYQEKFDLNKPTITGGSNAQCGKIIVSWNDNSNNESGFRLYRATEHFSGDTDKYKLIATLPAGSTAYTDNPPLSDSYYYIISAYSTTPNKVSASSHFHSSFNTPCTANIDGNLRVVAINGVPATSPKSINTGDTITFELMIDNYGPANGYITKITESLSANLSNPRNLQGSGPNMVLGTPKISGSSPEFTANVSGKKEVGGAKWIIKFDATANFLESGSTDSFTNCATIHYYDTTGNKTERVCLNQLMNSIEPREGLKFREVAP